MQIDTKMFPGNAVGRALFDTEVNYFYTMSPQTDLVIHYYNTKGWKSVCAFVSAKSEDGDVTLSDATPGSPMKADSSLGGGWYSLTISGKGSLSGITAKFSDGAGPETDEKVYSVDREVWIKDGEVTRTGDLNIIYINNGIVLGSDTQSGKVGEEYTTVGKEFENLRISGSTSNTSGTFTETPIYIIYRYDEMKLVEKPMMKVVILLGVTSFVTIAAAAALAIIYRRRKRIS